MKVAHLTTVDLSLRYLVFPQMLAVIEDSGEAMGISASGPFVTELEAAGVRHLPLRSSTRGMDLVADLRAARELWRILRREDLDVLHTHNPKPGLYGRVLGRLAGVPIVVNTVHGLYAAPDDPLPKRLLVYALEAIASRFSDAELVQSSEDLALLRRWRIIPRARARLLGNGVDLDRFDPERFDAGHRTRIRAELGVDEGQLVVGMVGRLVAEKGYPELFEAMRSLDDRFVLVSVGPDDPDKSDALDRELIKQVEHDGVRFLGMRTDVDQLYPAMDLFVLPSHREGFPRAAMEAAAMGLPIVATDIRGCREVVEPEVNGLLVPVRSPTGLASAIRRLGEDPELRSRMGKASQERARERFDERRVVEIVMDTYRQVARRKGLVSLLPAPTTDASPTIRPATRAEALACARLHAETMPTGFLPRLGIRFLTLLYRALLAFPSGVVLIGELGGHPAGFVAGTTDTAAFYRFFLRRFGPWAGLAALPRLLVPSNLVKAWETLRYDDPLGDVPAELVSLAVAGWARRQGVGLALGEALLDELSSQGAGKVRVVVGATNLGATTAYARMGFEEAVRIEVHAGEPSVVMLWQG